MTRSLSSHAGPLNPVSAGETFHVERLEILERPTNSSERVPRGTQRCGAWRRHSDIEASGQNGGPRSVIFLSHDGQDASIRLPHQFPCRITGIAPEEVIQALFHVKHLAYLLLVC
jgi:hypothetical protein